MEEQNAAAEEKEKTIADNEPQLIKEQNTITGDELGSECIKVYMNLDHLLCPITLGEYPLFFNTLFNKDTEFLKEPVTTPYGHTFEREAITKVTFEAVFVVFRSPFSTREDCILERLAKVYSG